MDISESLNYQEGWAKGYYALGANSIWLSEYQNALSFSLKSLELLKAEGLPEIEIEVLYNVAIIYFYIDDLDNAYKYALQCYQLSEEIDSDKGRAIGSNAKACVLYSDNRNEEAIIEIEKGLKFAKNSNDKEIIAKLYDGLGQAYCNLGNPDKAFEYKNKCLSIVRKLNIKNSISFALDGIGYIYFRKGEVEKAESHFQEALEIRKAIGFVAGEAQSYLHIASLRKLEKKYKEAVGFCAKSLDLGEEMNSDKIQFESYYLLAEIYEEQEDLLNFAINIKKYHEKKEAFLKGKFQKKYQTRELVSNMQQMDSERELLAKKNDELKKYSNDIRVLSEIGKELTSTLNFDEILRKVYNQVNSVMDASVFLIALYDQKSQNLSFELCVEKDVRMPDVSIQLKEGDGRLATYVVKNQKEVIINDYRKDIALLDGVSPGVLAGESTDSLIYMPIMNNDTLIGLISVQSFEKNVYTEYDIDLIRNLSVYAAIALKNAHSYRNIEEKVIERTKEIRFEKQKVENAYQNTKLIGELGQKLISSLNLDEVISDVYQLMNQLMDAQYFGLNVMDSNGEQLNCTYSIEKGVQQEKIQFNLSDKNNLSVWCAVNKKPLFIKDLANETPGILKGKKSVKVVRGEMPECCMFIPLMNNDEVLGVLTAQSFNKGAFGDYEFDILKSISSYFVIALENARSYESMEKVIETRTKEVTKQKEIIEEKNKRITDSIKYAKRIQEAILPAQEALVKYEKTSFVLFKPKDIVSGDFYWMEETKDKIIFAVVDCTGHGVPGAFMSIIGFNGLYHIVHERKITQPSEILTKLNKLVLNTLKQTEESDSVSDGMDIAICCFDKRKKILEFSGAFNPLYLIRKNELMQFKGDKFSVGSVKRKRVKEFANHIIPIEQGDRIYIFSDGYADQFGGERGKKLKYHRFRDLLLEIHEKPMNTQRKLLDKFIEDWKNGEDQVDDICVIGVNF